MRQWVFKILVLIVVLSFTPATWSESLCRRNFRVGALNNEPIYYRDNKGAIRGVLIELLEELKRRTGCNFDPLEATRPMLIANLRSSTIDLTLISIKTPAMDEVASFIPMYLGTRAIILSPDYAKKKPTLKEALKDKKILFGSFIGATGYYKPSEVEMLRKDQRLVEFYDYATMFAALKKGKIQATISSYVISSYFIVQLKLENFSFTQDPSSFTPVGSYYNPKRLRSDEVQMFSKIFDNIVKDGTMAKIYQHYIPKPYVDKSFVPRDFIPPK